MRQAEGFSRLDLMALLAVLGLVGGVLVSRLAAADAGADRERCRQNLVELGKAYSAWAGEHGGKLPWMLPEQEGGLRGSLSGGNAWVQVAYLSNHLASPMVLACPSDQARVATEWSRSGAGGFWHPAFRNNALSYFVGLDMKDDAPRALLGGDHHVEVSARAQRCELADVRTAASLSPEDDRLGWLPGKVHGESGQILFFDGSVATLGSEQLRAAARDSKAYHPDNHALWPR